MTKFNLFNLLKEHNWEKIKTILSDDNLEIDLNIRDNNNEYLLTYAILYNKLDITYIFKNHLLNQK